MPAHVCAIDIPPVGVAMHAVESIQITSIDIAIQNIPVDVDIIEAVTDVRTVAPINERA